MLLRIGTPSLIVRPPGKSFLSFQTPASVLKFNLSAAALGATSLRNNFGLEWILGCIPLFSAIIASMESSPLLVDQGLEDRSRTVSDTHSDYAEICLPNDSNTLGNMLGGHVMHLVDLCGAVAAMRHARSAVVTASIDQMTFLHPIRIGELVRLKSQVNRVFRTSMEVGVKVWVENLQSATLRHTSSAYLTFVAIDNAGNRVVLPPVIPETKEDQRRFSEAAERRAYRLACKDKAVNRPEA